MMRIFGSGLAAGGAFGGSGGVNGSVNGSANGDGFRDAAGHCVFQRVQVVGGAARHLPEHVVLASNAFRRIYGREAGLDPREVVRLVAECARIHHPSAQGACTMIVRLAPDDEGHGCRLDVEYERPLLEAGYAHSALRPRAVSFEYGLPFDTLPTAFQLSARALFDTLAFDFHGATRSVRRAGDVLVSCGESPIAAIRGRRLIVPPAGEWTVESVEAVLAVAVAPSARLAVERKPILHSELKSYDELMVVDAAGLTSLAECDGAKFMSLAAPRLAAAMR